MVLSASPTLTGTLTAPIVALASGSTFSDISNGYFIFRNSGNTSGVLLNTTTDGYAVFRNRANSADALITAGAATFSGALTYGGVTLSNSVTGTGNMVLSASPTFTGTLTAAAVSLSGQLTSTLANNTATGGGQIYLNGVTGNRIDWNTNGVAAPAFTTRSAGTKLVLYPSLDASNADYGFGIESGTLWSSVGGTGSLFKWYGGTTLAATLTGAGALTLVGGLSATTGTFSGTLGVTGVTTHTGATTLSAALTYGGVTLSNAVTGTGNMVLSASPTFTGTLSAATITASGDITSNSDLAFKSNIEIITNALDKLNSIKGITFNSDGVSYRRTGVIAQDVQTVLPEAIHTNSDGHLSVAYGNMIGLLVEAIKELNQKFKNMEDKR